MPQLPVAVFGFIVYHRYFTVIYNYFMHFYILFHRLSEEVKYYNKQKNYKLGTNIKRINDTVRITKMAGVTYSRIYVVL